MTPVPYRYLDPGIREVVRFMNDNGFHTTDSGDGVRQCAAGRGCTFPHVIARCSPLDMVQEARRLLDLPWSVVSLRSPVVEAT